MAFGSGFSSGFSSGFGGSEPDFVIEIDLNNDGYFSVAEDITAYVVSGSCFRGKDNGSNLKGEVVAGTLTADLLNLDGAWSRFNTGGPFYGTRFPGKAIRLRTTAPYADVLFTGFIDHVDPRVTNKGLPRATLYALGVFSKFTADNAQINVPALVDVYTGDVVDQCLDSFGFSATARDIDTGLVPVGRWYPGSGQVLELMREIKEQEGGELYEGKDWDVVFRNRYDRLLNHDTSVATFTDDGVGPLMYREIDQSDPEKEVFNSFEASITPATEGAEATLWTLSDGSITLAPGESRTYFADMPSSLDGQNLAYVNEWTFLTIGRDGSVVNTYAVDPDATYVKNLGDVQVTTTPFAKAIKITIENIDASSHVVDQLEQEGIPVVVGNTYKVTDEDEDSIEDHGRRFFPFTSRWFLNAAYARASMAYELERHKDEHPQITKTIVASDAGLFEQCVRREFGDRITVESESTQSQLGINQDFYIEAIAHSFGAKQLLKTTWTLSPVVDTLDGEDPFILGSSLLGGSDVLVF